MTAIDGGGFHVDINALRLHAVHAGPGQAGKQAQGQAKALLPRGKCWVRERISLPTVFGGGGACVRGSSGSHHLMGAH